LAGQKRFGSDGPLAGVLLDSGKRTGSSVIDRNTFNKQMVVTEIGFMLSKPVTRPLKDIFELLQHNLTVMPVIELFDLGFSDLQLLKVVDFITANVATAQFITGEEKELEGLKPNEIMVTLQLKGKNGQQGPGQ
jgi:2-keto-4-pentenoate hydratase